MSFSQLGKDTEFYKMNSTKRTISRVIKLVNLLLKWHSFTCRLMAISQSRIPRTYSNGIDQQILFVAGFIKQKTPQE